MSEYSLDSLENVEADSLEERVSDNDSDNGCNLVAIKDKFDKNASFYVNPIPPTSTQLKGSCLNGRDSGEEESLPTGRFVDDAPDDTTTTVHGGRNPIIASRRGFARRGRQQQECRATPAESWLCIRKSNDADVAAVGRREEGGADRRSRRRCCPRVRTSSGATTEQRSPGNVTRNSRRGSSDGMKADKRLDNVLVPSTWSRNPIGPPSYSELYRRRLRAIIPGGGVACQVVTIKNYRWIHRRYRKGLSPGTTSAYPRIRSPEGSTLSICGDSQLEDLSLDEGHTSLPATSRDDSSEFSFYRRFLEAHIDHAEILVRSCELRSSCETVAKFPDSVSDSKLKRSGYRPYTIEEYRSLSVSRPDRSLGPDKDEMLTKSRRAIAQKCFLPPLKDRDAAVAAASKDREKSRIPEMDDATQECLSKRPTGSSAKRAAAAEASSSRKTGLLGNTASPASSSLISGVSLEDPYLKTLQQRHLRERELADRLMRQTLSV
ncbi:hypothetical protein DMN91_000525 [Ooceraea biroi]|uniref:Uncharacterized protein n=1 Tax=Ooceraea biroi TaxID=2015173 RepID=A0A3L8E410_OOCBI|nr:hypothetical protein DMN91_000525 [Ooceraea biroi]